MVTPPKRAIATLVAVTLGGVLLSLVPLQRSQGGTIPCTEMGGPICGGGDCPGFQLCINVQGNCSCVPAGCCQNSTACLPFVDQGTCDEQAGQFVPGGGCVAGECKLPNGGGCDDPADCLSGNCVDDTCCADAACPPGQSCDNPGTEGICSPDPAAPAPAISRRGVLAALALLVAIGGLAVSRRRRGASESNGINWGGHDDDQSAR